MSTRKLLKMPDRTSSMVASDITNVLNFTSLTSYTSIVLLNKTTASVPTSEIIGVAPASEWLSDSPIVLMTQKLCAEHANAYCLSSMCSSTMSWEIPVDREHNWAFVVAPCNVSNVHWTLIVMDLKTSKASIFDPMESKSWTTTTRQRLDDVLIPAVNEWREAYYRLPVVGCDTEPQTWPKWDISVCAGPRQGDGDSCGVVVVAMAWCFLRSKLDGLPSFRGRFPAAATKILRLCLLWHLLCAPGVVVVNPTDRDWMEVISTELKLTKQLLDDAEEASS